MEMENMKYTEINVLEEIEVINPIFIEALPGLGHVGKLAADHLIDELEAVKFAEIYSPSFPPQVFVGNEGIIESMINELYYIKDLGEDNLDIILLVGNTQGLSPEAQYMLCKDILEFLEKFEISSIYTLGGLPTGKPVEDPQIFGAATCEENIKKLEEVGINIRSNDGGIVGASGLFLSIGKRKGLEGSCLMGETSGYFIDAEAAEAMLNKLTELLKFDVNTDKLDEKAKEIREMLEKAQKMEQELLNRSSASEGDDLRYIG